MKRRKGFGKMLPMMLRMLGKKPATILYPFIKVEMPQNFRGKLKFDATKCIGCKICERECPSDAIEISTIGEKKYKAEVFLDRCIYCAQCVESCPKKALESTRYFELALLNRQKLKVEI